MTMLKCIVVMYGQGTLLMLLLFHYYSRIMFLYDQNDYYDDVLEMFNDICMCIMQIILLKTCS